MALIHTKLNRPLVTDNFIPRPRLEDLLGEVLRKPLTLVSAPPGYGKSSMLSHQVQQYYCPVCWVSLDKSDNDLGLFLGYILTAIGKHFPKVVEQFDCPR